MSTRGSRPRSFEPDALIFENDQRLAHRLVTELQGLSLFVDRASSCHEAQLLLENRRYSLLLVGAGGESWEAAAEVVRVGSALPEPPTILVLTRDDAATRLACKVEGATLVAAGAEDNMIEPSVLRELVCR